MKDCCTKEEERVSVIRLIRSESIGNITFLSLIRAFGSACNAVKNIEKSPYGIKNVSGKQIVLISRDEVLKEIRDAFSYGAKMICFFDEDYPNLLKQIPDYPPVITVLGDNISVLRDHNRKVAIVGSRNASANGCRFAYKISRDLSDSGYYIVSGLARGIDTYAHRASVDSSRSTISVIAGGVDNIYPIENKSLYDDIVKGGLIITENAFGSIPKSQNFPRRNRVISGLSLATIVVEANFKSGSLITARYALEQNREIFAVPGFPMDARSSGTNRLIKDGAHIFTSANDVDEVFEFDVQRSLFDKSEDSNLAIDREISYISSSNSPKELNDMEGLILSKLTSSPISVDYLVDQLQVPINLMAAALVNLEIQDKIKKIGNEVCM